MPVSCTASEGERACDGLSDQRAAGLSGHDSPAGLSLNAVKRKRLKAVASGTKPAAANVRSALDCEEATE